MIDLIKDWKTALKIEEKRATTLEALFTCWQEFFFNRVMRLFVWNGLPFPQRELEIPLVCNGINYIAWNVNIKDYVTGSGSLYGVTRYPDVYTSVVYAMPSENGIVISGNPTIGKDAIAVYNTSTTLSFTHFVNRYASLMTHADLTLKSALVNYRATDILVGGEDSLNDSLTAYYNKRYNGTLSAIIDDSMLMSMGDSGLRNVGTGHSNPSLREIVDTQNEILRGFYRDIGVRWTKDKRAQVGESEVESDSSLLLFNISDMLACRQDACAEFNKVLSKFANIEISVKLAPEIEIIKSGKEKDNEDIQPPDSGQLSTSDGDPAL